MLIRARNKVHCQLLKAKVNKERLAALAYYLAQFKTLRFNAKAAREAAEVQKLGLAEQEW